MHRYKSSIIYYDIVLNSYYDSDYAEYAQYGKALAYLAMDEIQRAKEESEAEAALCYKAETPEYNELKQRLVTKKMRQFTTDLSRCS